MQQSAQIDLNYIPSGYILTNKDREIILVNDYFADLFGTPSAYLIHRSMFDFFTPASKILCDSYVFPLLYHHSSHEEIRLTFINSAGERIPVIANANLHSDLDECISWSFFNASQRDKLFQELVESRRLLEQQSIKLKQLATTDSLTGLPNLTLLTSRLKQKMVQALQEQQTFALAFLDLDNFKQINDEFGHHIGDKVLGFIAGRILHSVNDMGLVSRFGGDEFVFILDGDKDSITKTLTSLLSHIVQPMTIGAIQLHISGSIGVSYYPQGLNSEHLEPDQLIRQSDQAMYGAKLKGRNALNEFNIYEESQEIKRNQLHDDILTAADHHQFELYYQPKVNMRTHEILGVEALIRWNHPEKGLIMPNDFLPFISNHPLEIHIGQWVIETAIKQMSHWIDQDHPIGISVNIAGYHLQSSGFMDNLLETFRRYPNVPYNLLELEILETSAIDDLHQVDSILSECKMIGVKISLDDFGTGYSSLSHLKKLTVDTLKIDQTFVRNMLEDENDLAILTGVIGFANAFKRNVIAEGVETRAHMENLIELGCDLGQGYFIARPMPAKKLQEWMTQWRLNPILSAVTH